MTSCAAASRGIGCFGRGTPGTGKTTLAMHCLPAGIEAGETCLYMTLSKTKAEIENGARSHGDPSSNRRGGMRRAIAVTKKRSGYHERTIRELDMRARGIVVGEPLEEFRGILTGAPT